VWKSLKCVLSDEDLRLYKDSSSSSTAAVAVVAFADVDRVQGLPPQSSSSSSSDRPFLVEVVTKLGLSTVLSPRDEASQRALVLAIRTRLPSSVSFVRGVAQDAASAKGMDDLAASLSGLAVSAADAASLDAARAELADLLSRPSLAGTPLLVLANRDELYARPALALHAWPCAQVVAGKDAQAGGTWLGLGRGRGVGSQIRFAAITNFREPTLGSKDAPTRGTLVPDFLQSGSSAADFLNLPNNSVVELGSKIEI
jgi:hypothetical protein